MKPALTRNSESGGSEVTLDFTLLAVFSVLMFGMLLNHYRRSK